MLPRSALVVLIPEAESIVADLRLRYDPMAARGVPAHVTVLFPLLSPIDDTVERVGRIVSERSPFRTSFAALDHFPGVVVWLRPEPAEPFLALIAAATAEFPACPPYGGTVAEPIPHLTVANGVDASTAERVRAELEPSLPISAQITELALLVEDDAGHWTIDRTWQFGADVARRGRG